jgi:hypothetical protein
MDFVTRIQAADFSYNLVTYEGNVRPKYRRSGSAADSIAVFRN